MTDFRKQTRREQRWTNDRERVGGAARATNKVGTIGARLTLFDVGFEWQKMGGISSGIIFEVMQ